MNSKTLRTKSVSNLTQEMKDAQSRLRELRFKRSSNQLKQVREIRDVRRNIARIKTILGQKHTEEFIKAE
ncbi:MAG: 50S ribosomal protein L29 [Candidatus Uhrbacteria bacterium GW2011_GWF2_39_13]|uniref:Large ribosomal subunit protein uL29 n=1 Tax=Candidatus Uhrbacteria bacterium GW2011_GWF2_39_13 TaxID=1618995 RepID=A0A0G0MIA6_9BACT|nr:MAG: 50S ribosomal protein L29 [Candidatus Uhrbacteria bacterium GW2011_GWF2_39_13]HAU66739.1 50S ribosomal protein L29 [Candidatus Uhrbacteria bacterium]